MNERNLSRRLSTSVVDALKAHGHILVVKGGATALARELDELMAPDIATIEPRIKPRSLLVGEPTSTFGDETVDQAVEDMVVNLTHALMNSDHVEDVFAEDAVIRRDIFRVMRDGLREPLAADADAGDDHEGNASVTVQLETLGYVAATASRRTDPSTLRQALDRAASAVQARFSGFRPELREATFRLEGGGLDERLELEEAVADELTDLVEQGIVELPTIERRIDLGRALPASEQRALRGRIDAAAQATLLRSGVHATWELDDPRTIRVLFTPLSEQDAHGVDAPTSAFAREIAAVLASGREPRAGRDRAAGAAKQPPAPPSAREPAIERAAAASPPEAPPRRKAARSKDAAPPSAREPGSASRARAHEEGSAPKTPAREASAPKAPAREASAPKAKAAKRSPSAKAATSRKSPAPRAAKASPAPRSTSKRASTAAAARDGAAAPKPRARGATPAAKPRATKAPTKKR